MNCRLCDSQQMVSVLDLGATPPGGKFLSPNELDLPEPTFPLHLRICENCLLLQLPKFVTPEHSFSDHPYFSSSSDSCVDHARTFVEQSVKRLGLNSDSLVVEVASNDGYLLQHVVARGVPCVGIEPSVNLGATARERGVPTITESLSEAPARRVREEFGPANLVVANNVYAHICDLLEFTRALRMLLADDGWLSIEVHHALPLVRRAQFDTICHQHFQYFTLLSATRALATAGLTVVDVEQLPTHGGSLRIWARPSRIAAPPSARVIEVLRAERAAGLQRVQGYLQLRHRTEVLRQNLLRFLLHARIDGKRVVGYGTPIMANTLLNYCGIRSDLLEYIVDPNPYKHGRYTPGTRIPIRDPRSIEKDRPDIVLGLPWNLEGELRQQLVYITEWGGELVFPPNLQNPWTLETAAV